MKVCLLNESFPPVLDGVANVLLNYANYMIKDFNADICVGTPRYPDADYSQYPYKVVPYRSFDTAAVASGYRTGNPFDSKDVMEMSAFQPDIIHAHCPATALIVARLLREQTGAPIVFTYHTKYDIDIERWVKVHAIAEEGIRAYVKNIEACDEVWTVSRGAGESLKALGYKGEYRVMNNGVDFAKGRVAKEDVDKVTAGYDLPENVPLFLFVGRLISYKGIPMILDALKEVQDAGQDFRMVFVGKGPDRELFENRAKELGIADKVFFTGPIYDRDALRAWNTRADLFLFPSTFDTNGLVVREAAACGLASVLIRDSCASEGITDDRNGFIIEENSHSMAELLLKVAPNPDHMHDVGQHAMDEIYMSWEDCVAEAYHRYEEILARKKIGVLKAPAKQSTDFWIRLVAGEMESQSKFRELRHDIFNDFRTSVSGMMENIQETADAPEGLGERMKKDWKETKAELIGSIHETRDNISEMTKETIQETKESIREAKDTIRETRDTIQEKTLATIQETQEKTLESIQEKKESLQEKKETIQAKTRESIQETKESIQEIRDRVLDEYTERQRLMDIIEGTE